MAGKLEREEPLARALAAIHATDTAGLPDLPLRDDPLPGLRQWLPELGGLEQVCTRTASGGAGPHRLLHGDYWPGNVLWQQGRLAAVLDWEDAALGGPSPARTSNWRAWPATPSPGSSRPSICS